MYLHVYVLCENLADHRACIYLMHCVLFVFQGPFDVCRKVFSGGEETAHMTIADKSDLFFHDYSIGPLFVQENYILVTPFCARLIGNELCLFCGAMYKYLYCIDSAGKLLLLFITVYFYHYLVHFCLTGLFLWLLSQVGFVSVIGVGVFCRLNAIPVV